MGEVGRFISQFTSRFDAKGRLSVPASFRAVMPRDKSETLYLYHSLYLPALDCGGTELLEDVEELLSNWSPHSEEWDVLATAVYGPSEIVKIDSEGRIILSEAARSYAGLSGEATFVGLGRKFQIWEPARFRAHFEEARRRVREQRTEFGASSAKRGTPASSTRGARE
jgi:MraZ protein